VIFRELSLEEFQQFRSKVDPLPEERITEEIHKANEEYERKRKEKPGGRFPPPDSVVSV
jgi:hypothetical protein